MSELGAPPPPCVAEAARGSSWPDLIGVIGIIFGALGMLSQLGNVLAPFSGELALRLAGQFMPTGTWEGLARMLPPPYLISLLGLAELALVTLLLAGSISLKHRNRSAVTILRLWAVGASLWTVGEGVYTAVLLQQMLPGLTGIHEVGRLGMPVLPIAWFSTLIGLLLALSGPLFVLIWFARDSVKQETTRWPA